MPARGWEVRVLSRLAVPLSVKAIHAIEFLKAMGSLVLLEGGNQKDLLDIFAITPLVCRFSLPPVSPAH